MQIKYQDCLFHSIFKYTLGVYVCFFFLRESKHTEDDLNSIGSAATTLPSANSCKIPNFVARVYQPISAEHQNYEGKKNSNTNTLVCLRKCSNINIDTHFASPIHLRYRVTCVHANCGGKKMIEISLVYSVISLKIY